MTCPAGTYPIGIGATSNTSTCQPCANLLFSDTLPPGNNNCNTQCNSCPVIVKKSNSGADTIVIKPAVPDKPSGGGPSGGGGGKPSTGGGGGTPSTGGGGGGTSSGGGGTPSTGGGGTPSTGGGGGTTPSGGGGGTPSTTGTSASSASGSSGTTTGDASGAAATVKVDAGTAVRPHTWVVALLFMSCVGWNFPHR